jgi:hypothetical protein
VTGPAVDWAKLLREFVSRRTCSADDGGLCDAGDRSGSVSYEELRKFVDDLTELAKDVKFVAIPFKEDGK